MLKSAWSGFKLNVDGAPKLSAFLCVLAICVFFTFPAVGQGTTEFTLQPSSLSPDAVAPGGTSSTNIQVGSVNGFNGTVSLGCQVTSAQLATDPPVCTVSPPSVTPSAGATATITTKPTTSTINYSITITGTGPTTTYSAPPLTLTVLSVVPQFTITVQTALSPTSVIAGSGAQGIVSVNPTNGYISPSGGVTLSCSSIAPLVTIAPVCSFSYPTGQNSLSVNGTPATSTITISTFGPVTTGAASRPRTFYALWFSLPMLALVGLGAATGGKRSRRVWGLLAVIVVTASLLLMPACGNTTSSTTSTPNGVTPANTYTFTIIGVDANGVVSSNTGTSTSAGPTVSLTVTAPK